MQPLEDEEVFYSIFNLAMILKSLQLSTKISCTLIKFMGQYMILFSESKQGSVCNV